MPPKVAGSVPGGAHAWVLGLSPVRACVEVTRWCFSLPRSGLRFRQKSPPVGEALLKVAFKQTGIGRKPFSSRVSRSRHLSESPCPPAVPVTGGR